MFTKDNQQKMTKEMLMIKLDFYILHLCFKYLLLQFIFIKTKSI